MTRGSPSLPSDREPALSPLIADERNPARDEDLRWAEIAGLPWSEARALVHEWGQTGAIGLEQRLVMFSAICPRMPPEERERLRQTRRSRRGGEHGRRRLWDAPDYPGVRPDE